MRLVSLVMLEAEEFAFDTMLWFSGGDVQYLWVRTF